MGRMWEGSEKEGRMEGKRRKQGEMRREEEESRRRGKGEEGKVERREGS